MCWSWLPAELMFAIIVSEVRCWMQRPVLVTDVVTDSICADACYRKARR